MRITFKAFASLADHLPPPGGPWPRTGNELAVELPEGTSVQAAIDRFNMPRPLVHLVLVNGTYVPPAARAGHALHEGDALAVWPQIAGG